MLVAPETCPACGTGTVALREGPGRFTWSNLHGYIPVPETLRIPTCSDCKAEWMDEPTTDALDAFEKSWRPPPDWKRVRKHDPNCGFYPCDCGCIPDVKPTDRGTCTCWILGEEEDTLTP